MPKNQKQRQKQRQNRNRTKRIPKYNNSNTESVNIGSNPGINKFSVKGLLLENRNNKSFNRTKRNYNNNNLQNSKSNFYQNVGNFPVDNNSDYDVIYKSVSKISSEDLWKIYEKIQNTQLQNNINNTNDYDSLERLIYVYYHPEERNTVNEFWYSVLLRIEALDAITSIVNNEIRLTIEQTFFNENGNEYEEAFQNTFTLDLSNMSLIEIAYPLESLDDMRTLHCENNRLEKIPRLSKNLEQVNFDNNPLTPPYLSIYKKYRETGDIQQFIKKVNQENTSEILEKIKKPLLPTNVTRHIAKFVEGGKRKKNIKQTRKIKRKIKLI